MALGTDWATAWMEGARQSIAEHREELIDLDRQIGDGDHGENMDRGFAGVSKALEGDDVPGTPGDILKLVAKTLMSTVGGAAGPLYGTAFLRASKALEGDEVSGEQAAAMVQAALDGIQARGKAERGEKTMVDAWGPAADAAKAAADEGADAADVLRAAADAAAAGAAATEPLKATKGRASYLGDRSIGHLDPGAVSTSYILEEAAKAAGR